MSWEPIFLIVAEMEKVILFLICIFFSPALIERRCNNVTGNVKSLQQLFVLVNKFNFKSSDIRPCLRVEVA